MEYDEWRSDRQRRSRERTGLTPTEWAVLRMMMFEGYQQREIGQLMGLTTVSIGQHYDNGRRKLWEFLNQRYGDA